MYSRKRWRQVQEIANGFWHKWRQQYLSLLQLRQKWNKKLPELKVDDVVILKEGQVRNEHKLARVVECENSEIENG